MNIRFGIVGCGKIAQRHAEHIINHKRGELVACYDNSLSQNIAFVNKWNIKGCNSLEEILSERIDCINICTPNNTHSEIAIKALRSGKNVLVEKPMAIKKKDCLKMIDVAKKMHRELFVVKQNRYNPLIVDLKKVVEEDRLGRIFMVIVNCFWNRNDDYYKSSNWKGREREDGGTLYTQFSHFVDIMYYLFGDIEWYNGGIMENMNHLNTIEFEDTGVFNFSLMNGAIGSLNYTTAAFEENMEGSITIFGENGTIKIGGQYLNKIDYQKTKGFDLVDRGDSRGANQYGLYQGSMSNHDRVIDNVIKTLNKEEEIMTNGYDGMKVVNIIEQFYKSSY